MKKLLALVLVMVLAVTALTGCSLDTVKGTFNNAKEKVVDTFNNVKVTVGGWFGIEFPEDDDEPKVNPNLATAGAQIYHLYKDVDAKTPANYNLVSVVPVEDDSFNVVWTVSVDSITIKDNGNGTVTVIVPENPDTAIEYTLTATLTDEFGNKVEKTFKRIVPGVNVSYKEVDYAGYVAALDDTGIIVKGIVSGIFSKSVAGSYNAVYVQDLNGEGGYYIYSLKDEKDPVKDLGLQVGMTVSVKGLKVNYDSGYDSDPIVYEVTDGEVTITDSAIKAVPEIDLTAAYTAAADLKDAALLSKLGAYVTIKGVTIGGQKTDNGYYYFNIGELQSYVRISSSTNAISAADQEAFKQVHTANKGATADVSGIVTHYKGAFYLVPATKDAFKITEAITYTPTEQVANVKTALTLETDIRKDTELTLPSTLLYDGVTITWTVDGVAATSDKLSLTIGDEVKTITLVATISAGEGDAKVTDTKEIVIKVAKKISKIELTDSVTADFGTLAEDTGYAERITDNGWVIANAATKDGNGKFTDDIVIINGKTSAVGTITSPVFVGKLSYLTFNFGLPFSESNGVNLTVYVMKEDGTELAKKDVVSNIAKGETSSFEWTLETAIEGEFYIYIVNNSPSESTSNKDRTAIWDLTLFANLLTDENKVDNELESIKLPMDTFTIDHSIALPVAKTEGLTLTWSVAENANVKVVDGKLVVTMPEADATVTLTATVSVGEGETKVEKTKDFTITLDVPNWTLSDPVTAPAANVAYKLVVEQLNLGKVIFFDGTMGQYNPNASDKLIDAANVYAEIVDGGFKLYFINADGETKYFEAYSSSNSAGTTFYGNLRFKDETATVFSIDSETGAIVTSLTYTKKVDEVDTEVTTVYYLGSYGTNAYPSLSDIYYITGEKASSVGVSNFLAYLATYTCEHEYEKECSVDCLVCGEVRPVEDSKHTYDNVCDVDCNVCGNKREVEEHKDVKNNETGADGADGKCDACGYLMTEIELGRINETIEEITVATEYTKSIQFKLPVVGTKWNSVSITWKSSDDTVVKVVDGLVTVDLPADYGTEVTLTAIFVCGGTTFEKDYTLTISEAPAFDMLTIISPVVNTPYKFYLYQATLGKNIYLAGGLDGNYFAATDKAANAVDVYLEAVEGGYRIYYKDGETKMYLDVYEYKAGSVGVQLTDTPTCTWVYDKDLGILVTNVLGSDYYLGTFGENGYIRASKTSYITGDNAANVGVSQFVAAFATYTCEHEYGFKCGETCLGCGFTEVHPDEEHDYANACDVDCGVCGKIREVNPHVDENPADSKCDICGESMAEIEKARIEETKKEVSVANSALAGSTITLPNVGTLYTNVEIAWSVSDGATLADDGVTVTFGKEKGTVTLTATFVCGLTEVTETYTVDVVVTSNVTSLVAGTYKLYSSKYGVFFNGTANGKLQASDNFADAADITLVAVEGKENTYNILVGGKYLVMTGEGATNLYLKDALTEGETTYYGEWSFEAETKSIYNAWDGDDDGKYRYIAAYNSNGTTTFRAYEPSCDYVSLVIVNCNHPYATNCSTECSKCDGGTRVVDANAHQYDNDCDTDCNLCSFERTVADHYDGEDDDFLCDSCQKPMTEVEKAVIAETKANLVVPTSFTNSKVFSLPTKVGKVDIVWSSNNGAVVVEGGKVTVTLGDAAIEGVVLTAAMTCGSTTENSEYALTLAAKTTPLAVTDYAVLEEGKPYKFYAFNAHASYNKNLYITGEVSQSKYLVTTDKASKAADVYVKIVDGGYKFYIIEDGVDKYIYLSASNAVNIAAESETVTGSVFTYNALGLWQTTVGGTDCYLGMYINSSNGKTYNTISVSKVSYVNSDNIGITQFASQLATYECAHAHDSDCDVDCNACGEVREAGNHTPAGEQTDCTVAVNCSECGGVAIPATSHQPAGEQTDCTVAVNCSVCGKEAIPAKAHTPAGEQTDCTVAVECSVCGGTAIEAGEHVYDSSNCCDTTCNKCDNGTREVEGHVDLVGADGVEGADGHCDKCGWDLDLETNYDTPLVPASVDEEEAA